VLVAVVKQEGRNGRARLKPAARRVAVFVHDDAHAGATRGEQVRLVARLARRAENTLAVRDFDARAALAPVAAAEDRHVVPRVAEEPGEERDARRLTRPADRQVADADDRRAEAMSLEDSSFVEGEARADAALVNFGGEVEQRADERGSGHGESGAEAGEFQI
jgi:hypothetical protein